jgi:thymidylate kinase
MLTSNQTPGSLIVFEGPDGAGKTTIVAGYAALRRSRGSAVTTLSFPGDEPNSLGFLVYGIHHRPAHYGVAAITPESLQALHVAAHLDAIDRCIRPRIARGETVILDRYWWSTWVYGIDEGGKRATIEALVECERQHWGALTPTVVILLTRQDSLRPEDGGPAWARRLSLYQEIAARERGRYPVRTVSTDTTETESLVRVDAAVEDAHEQIFRPSPLGKYDRT